MILYAYTRWGNTSRMWGSNGVIENLDILLRWMEEDPVDTWEMGRNDAVETIIGTRNVFVDYPEYAWLLFGRELPADMVTPSGMAADNTSPDLPPVTEDDFEMTQPEPPPATEDDFEMTQPEPPPLPDDFEMTQPEPPPLPDDFEMTQPEPPPTEPESELASEPDHESASAAPTESFEQTTAAPTDNDDTGCASLAAGGTVLLTLSLSALSVLLTLTKRQREE